MGSRVDLDQLPQHYPGARRLHAEPGIWLFENFAGSEELAALREAAWEKLQPAEVSGEAGGYLSSGRTGSNCWVAHDHDALTLQLAQRISRLAGLPLTHAESFQVVHYGPQQEYKPHYDAWEHDSPRGQRCMARGGQRLVTALLYLNHVEAGGATGFPRLGFDVRPLPGNLLLFHNCHAGSNHKHDASLHGGLPVTAGEKWAANLWFREEPFRQD